MQTSCKICLCPLTEGSYIEKIRVVSLHTLIHGTIGAQVVDVVCKHCSSISYFDGKDLALFAATEKSVYSREILDYLLYHVTCLGATFREAHESFLRINRFTSVKKARLGGPPGTRKSSNTCFALVLKTLCIESSSCVSKIFRCEKFEDYSGRINAIAWMEQVLECLEIFRPMLANIFWRLWAPGCTGLSTY